MCMAQGFKPVPPNEFSKQLNNHSIVIGKLHVEINISIVFLSVHTCPLLMPFIEENIKNPDDVCISYLYTYLFAWLVIAASTARCHFTHTD